MHLSQDDHVTDVAIIGGGILGLATSCELLSQGYDVTLIEPGAASSATRASAGMLSPFAEASIPTPTLELLGLARQAYPEFVRNVEETSGCRVECRFPGTLVTSADPGRDLSEATFRFRELGARATYLNADDLAASEPGLAVDAAVLLEDEGYVDPRGLHDALRAAFEELGGRWVRDEAHDLIVERNEVRGVLAGAGRVHAGAVVNTAGVRAERFLLAEDRLRLRPRPVRGELLRLRPPRRADRIRHVVQIPGRVYLVPQDDGTVIAGATSYEGDGRNRVSASGIAAILGNTAQVLPESKDWEWVEAWSGLRPKAGEGEPAVFGDRRPGLVHGLGLYRNGILLAPVIAGQLSSLAQEHLGRPPRDSREATLEEPAGEMGRS